MRAVLIVSIMLLIAVLGYNRINEAHSEGFKLGMRYALKTNPPSEELELVCVGLWIGEQNKKYYQKEKNK